MSRLAEGLLLRLFRRFPPDTSLLIFQEPKGRAESEYRAELRLPLASYFRSSFELFFGKDVLDVGSGFGGRPVRFLESGAKSVTGLEVSAEKVTSGRAFAERRGKSGAMRFVLGCAESMPLPDEQFDTITMLDTLEHVFSPADVLVECSRVLRPSGRVAIVFPPYYSFTAGSHLSGYATSLPGLNLLFSTKTLRSATKKRLEEQQVNFREFLRDVPTDKLWNLNGLTIRNFLRLSGSSGFRLLYIRYQPHVEFADVSDRAEAPLAKRVVFAAAKSLAATPLVREVCCLRVCAILEKR